MKRTYSYCPFARYADDAVVHCCSQKQAELVMHSIASRLEACGFAGLAFEKILERLRSTPEVSMLWSMQVLAPVQASVLGEQPVQVS